MKKILYLVLFLAGSTLVAQANYDPEHWQYFKEIKIENLPSAGQLVEVGLDQDVFGHAKNDLSDLRIINSRGEETPYKLVIERGAFSENNIYPVKILNNSFIAGQYNLFVVDFNQAGLLNSALNILTPSENFRRQVEISGSNDMQGWAVLKGDGYIYDYTDRQAGFKAQNTEINYPENTYRYLQVKIFMGGESFLQVAGAQVSRITKTQTKETVLAPTFETRQNSEKKSTEIIIDLNKTGWPTSSILLASPNENYNREVAIYESNDKSDWRFLGQSYIFNYNTPKFKGASLEIRYSESSRRYLRVMIYNGDNQPISLTGLTVKAILRNIAFQSAPETNFRLYYGNTKATFAEYDLEKFFGYLDTGNYQKGQLLGQQTNSLFKEEVAPKPPLSERIPYLLPSALILVVLILGFFVYRFLKQVQT